MTIRNLIDRVGLLSAVGITDREGNLDRPVSQRKWAVPLRISVDGERLVYAGECDRTAHSEAKLLEDFLRLDGASSESILKYARSHGVLYLCVHDRPAHLLRGGRACMPTGWDEENSSGWEPLQAWRNYARQIRAILKMAANLHHGKPCDPSDILAFNQPDPEKAKEWLKMGVAEPRQEGRFHSEAAERERVSSHRALVANVINSWLWYGDVYPGLFWSEENPRLELTGTGLFGALATQLVLAISRTGGLVFCSGCGAPYFPERRPREGERHYCDECREAKIPERDAARDYRRKMMRRKVGRKT